MNGRSCLILFGEGFGDVCPTATITSLDINRFGLLQNLVYVAGGFGSRIGDAFLEEIFGAA